MKTWKRLKGTPTLWERYFIREKVIAAIRLFFAEELFHEVETPLLIAHPPAESYVDVFETTLLDRQRRSQKAYLATSPEVHLKKLLVAGIGNCYSLGKSFPNMETQSNLHSPEFTILEWYRVGSDYTAIMEDCERLLQTLRHFVLGERPLVYQGKTVSLTSPWERMTVAESFLKWASIDIDSLFDEGSLRKIAASKGYKVEEKTTWEELYNQIFLNEIEPHLGRGKPTILYEFPSSMAALSKTKASDPRVSERFEFYIEGLELGDCYSELTDWQEQESRFQKEQEQIRRMGKTTYEYDQDFIEALKVGLPECSGIAVGVDRLIMLLADTTNITETQFFPIPEAFEKSE